MADSDSSRNVLSFGESDDNSDASMRVLHANDEVQEAPTEADRKLLAAAREQNLKGIKEALAEGANVNICAEMPGVERGNPDGILSPLELVVCCKRPNVEIAKYLIEDAKAYTRKNLLQYILDSDPDDSLTIFRYLLESAKVPFRDDVVHHCCFLGLKAHVELLMNHGGAKIEVSLLNRPCKKYDYNCYKAALQSGNTELVQFILEKNNIRQVGSGWYDMIHGILCHRVLNPSNLEMARFLIQFTGANINAIHYHLDCTLLSHICGKRSGDEDRTMVLVRFLVEELGATDKIEGSRSAFFSNISSLYPKFQVLQYLIDHAGADPNVFSPAGELPLVKAVRSPRKKIEVLEFMLNLGIVSVEKSQSDGITALLAACEDGNFESARLLVERGGASLENNGIKHAKDAPPLLPSIRNSPINATPLYAACCSKKPDVFLIKYLVEQGSRIVSDEGRNCISLFESSGKKRMAKYMKSQQHNRIWNLLQFLNGKHWFIDHGAVHGGLAKRRKFET